jgi:hypothetical protein
LIQSLRDNPRHDRRPGAVSGERRRSEPDTNAHRPVVPVSRFSGHPFDEHSDRRQEFGRDACNIRFKLPSGHFIYCALQVKKGDISAASGKPTRDIMGLLNQAEKALEKDDV